MKPAKAICFILLLIAQLFNCQGEDTIGKIVIEYDGNWSATITENYSKSILNGTGDKIITYTNPNKLKVTTTKEDTSLTKLIIYIYENERIVSGESTREPEGSITAEYEFPF